MPTTPQEIDCPECGGEGQIEFMCGHTITDILTCETCHGGGKVTVIPCPRHGTAGYTHSEGGPTLDCMDCRAESTDEICNLNHLLTRDCIVPAELIAIAEASARGEDYDYDRFNVLFQEAR